MNYGEGIRHSAPTSDSFDIIRPTIELPLDEILMETGDCSEAWPMPVYPPVSTTDSQSHGHQLELTTDMKSEYEHQHPAFLFSSPLCSTCLATGTDGPLLPCKTWATVVKHPWVPVHHDRRSVSAPRVR
jgi:hypothetical protein